jgi:hypothetical protein
VQTPVSLNSLHDKTLFNGSTTVSPGSPVTIPTQGNSSFEFETTVLGGGNGRLDINILNDAGEQVTVGVDWDNNGQVYVERGQTNGFSNRYFTNTSPCRNPMMITPLRFTYWWTVPSWKFSWMTVSKFVPVVSLWPVGLRRKCNGRRLITLSWSRISKPIR